MLSMKNMVNLLDNIILNKKIILYYIMNNDKQTSQLKNSFFTVDAEDAKKIQMQLPLVSSTVINPVMMFFTSQFYYERNTI